MNFRYDAQADAAYIRLIAIGPGSVADTVCVADEFPELRGDVNLDLDRNGRLVGIEIMGARRLLPPELLTD
jgi:uncharacterized protein YuzE